jgi:hypothetical protein
LLVAGEAPELSTVNWHGTSTALAQDNDLSSDILDDLAACTSSGFCHHQLHLIFDYTPAHQDDQGGRTPGEGRFGGLLFGRQGARAPSADLDPGG